MGSSAPPGNWIAPAQVIFIFQSLVQCPKGPPAGHFKKTQDQLVQSFMTFWTNVSDSPRFNIGQEGKQEAAGLGWRILGLAVEIDICYRLMLATPAAS